MLKVLFLLLSGFRAHRSRHLRHTKSHLSRIERRTALSLRPISSKSYADPHSPMNCNSEDSDVEKTSTLTKYK